MTRWRVSVLLCVPLLVWPSVGQEREPDDIRYLVIRRAGRPEKNYYELAKQVSLLGGDVITKGPQGIRYGVHSIWRVRVRRTTDSQNDSASAKDSHYILIYQRDPDVRFCARRYEFSSLPSGARRIDYTDCEDKRQYTFQMTQQWPRPFVIYEVEVLNRDVLHDLLKQEHSPGQAAVRSQFY